MQVNHLWVVRTPYRDANLTFKQARAMFEARAKGLGIDIKWRKGRGRYDDMERYHYWFIDNETDAIAFHLAFGDQIVKWRIA